MPNLYVWSVSLFVSLGASLCGYYDGSMNGILEMNGFQHTFHRLYQSDSMIDHESVSHSGSKKMQHFDSENMSHHPENHNHTKSYCSSGNGPSSDILIGTVVSLSGLGSTGGALLAGWLSDRYSRKYGLLLSGLIFAIGSILLATSFHISTLYIGRYICGIAVGIIYMVMPVYISEISPKEFRGMMTSLIGPGYAMGILVALCTNIGFSRLQAGWRVAVGIQALTGLFFSFGMAFVPQTPRWLVLKYRDKEAHFILAKINYHKDNIRCIDTHFELEELKSSTVRMKTSELLKEILKWKYISRLLLVVLLFLSFAATGNFIYFFSTTLFCEINVPPFYSTLAVGLIILLASVLLPFFIDKVGRKVSLLCGSAVNVILAITVAILDRVFGSSEHQAVSFIIVSLICIYAFSISCTWLTIPWTITSEVFPINIKGLTVSISTSSYWFNTFLINQVIPLVLGSIGSDGFFHIMAAINFLSIFFVIFALPETKGVSLEQMDAVFSHSDCKKRLQCISYCRCPERIRKDLQPSCDTGAKFEGDLKLEDNCKPVAITSQPSRQESDHVL